MRIIFMGTPDFSETSLKRLIEDGHEIPAVFTQPDKPKGRGQKLAFSPVKELALANGLTVYQPKSLKNGETAELISGLRPEAIVVVAYGKILPYAILEIPKYGCINLHGSLLPKYRGAAPIQRSILNGEKITGVTTMVMADGIDTGDILEKAEVLIGENETSAELFDRLAVIGAELLSHTILELPKGTLMPQKQVDSLATHAAMLSKEETEVDFSLSAQEVHNKIRGLSDWPCAAVTLQGKRLKIYKSEIADTDKSGRPGEIVDLKNFTVACGTGAVKLVLVQYEGSKKMDGGEFLRGRRLSQGEILEPTR